MEFRNQESALQYMNERKSQIMAEIKREREENNRQCQKLRSIPEVKALVDEVVRLMRGNYYSNVNVLRDKILLKTSSSQSYTAATKILYSTFNLGSLQNSQIAFVKLLCEEVYKQTGYDLQSNAFASFCGSPNVITGKFKLNIYDDDCGLPPAHGSQVRVHQCFSGRNIISEIFNFRSRFCSIDLFQVDNYNRIYQHDLPDIAETPVGFFRLAYFYEITYVRSISPDSGHFDVGIPLFNITPDPNSKPDTRVNW